MCHCSTSSAPKTSKSGKTTNFPFLFVYVRGAKGPAKNLGHLLIFLEKFVNKNAMKVVLESV